MTPKTLQYFADTDLRCTRCNGCGCRHQGVDFPPFTYGALAQRLLQCYKEGAPPEPSLQRLIRSCDFCGACVAHCPAGIDAKTFMRSARVLLMEQDPSLAQRYRNVRVDYKNNLFSMLRQALGAVYEEALEPNSGRTAHSLFLPSCHMGSKFPSLTHASYTFLKKHGIADGITAYCCGNALYCTGLEAEFDRYAKGFAKALQTAKVQRIVTPCANCYDFLLRLQQMGYLDSSLAVLALPAELAKRGIAAEADPAAAAIAVHDSCPDRHRGIFADGIREVLKNREVVEMACAGIDTMCCGSGGLSPFGDKEVGQTVKSNKAAQCRATGAGHLVTTCFNCADSLAQAVHPMETHHFMEYLLGHQADWQAYAQAKVKMQQADFGLQDKMQDITLQFENFEEQ